MCLRWFENIQQTGRFGFLISQILLTPFLVSSRSRSVPQFPTPNSIGERPEVRIRYDWIFIFIFIETFVCFKVLQQFYLSPRWPCLLRDVCVGVSEVTEKTRTNSLICFVFLYSGTPVPSWRRCDSGFKMQVSTLGFLACWFVFDSFLYVKGSEFELALTTPFSSPGVQFQPSGIESNNCTLQ